MEAFIKNIVMFIGSNKGLVFVWILIYTVYIVLRTGKYIYLLWLIIPLIPLIHFFINKKTRVMWIIFAMIAFLHISFIYFLEPSIADERIRRIEFNFNNQEYIIEQEKQPESITNIKWDIYKNDLFHNLGINDNPISDDSMGNIRISVSKAVINRKYDLERIIKILEPSK